MKLVQQRRFGECGAACLAMVLGLDLDHVLREFPDLTNGICEDDMIQYLGCHGVPALASVAWPSLSISAILTVPSLNHPGVLHFVVWDAASQTVLDPSNEEKRWPNDGPKLGSAPVQWASALLLWPIRDDA